MMVAPARQFGRTPARMPEQARPLCESHTSQIPKRKFPGYVEALRADYLPKGVPLVPRG